jgi:hypothetical protein
MDMKFFRTVERKRRRDRISNDIRVIKSRRMRCAGEGRGAYKVLVWKAERMRPLGKCRHRWEDNIKMDL